jgi:hypothetical protein
VIQIKVATGEIEKIINCIGKIEYEKEDGGIKIYGYK